MTGILSVYVFVCIAYCVSDSSNAVQAGQEESRLSDLSSVRKCPWAAGRNCSELSNLCLNCTNYTTNCTYGELVTVTCKPLEGVDCEKNPGEEYFTKQAKCVFCYQTEKWEYTCERKRLCQSGLTKPQKTNCTVHNDVMCLGHRTFEMKLKWNCTRGHKWSTALILSITLGGFGADRFYLGHWQEGIGKLFSFGGLGVWTLVDVLLIAIRYLGPADGSFYV